MGIFDWFGRLTRKSYPVNTAAVNYGLMRAMFGGNEIRPADAERLYSSVSTLAICVDMIANEIAKIKPVVKINGEKVLDHEVNALLAYPGYGRSGDQFSKELAIEFLLTGNANLFSMGNSNRLPTRLDLFKTAHCTPIEGHDGWPERYLVNEARRSFNFRRVEVSAEGQRYFDGDVNGVALRELVPIYDPGGRHKGIGRSKIEAVRAEMEMKYSGVLHNLGLLRNGARLSGFLIMKERMDADMVEQLRDDFQALATGPENAGKVQFLQGEGSFIPAQSTAKDMDWARMQELAEQALEKRYGIPAAMFATDAQTHNNYNTANKLFYETAVLPNFKAIYDALANHFTQRMGGQAYIELTHDPLSIPCLAAQAADDAQGLFNSKIITTNEARDRIGMEPLPGGWDIRTSMGEVPLSEADYDYSDIIAEPGADSGPGPSDSEKAIFRKALGDAAGTVFQKLH